MSDLIPDRSRAQPVDDLTALRLQLEWGADEAIGDAPIDRFVAAPAPRPRIGPMVARVIAPPGPPPPARRAAGSDTVDALMAELETFEGCSLRATAMRTVRPDGNRAARLVVIGDAPGSDDDRSGQAFSGAAGALVDRVLGAIGLDRNAMLLATLVPWRPPGGRPLNDGEVQACLPFLHRLLGIVRPSHLLLTGSLSVKALAGQDVSVRRLRGKWLEVQIANEQLSMQALAVPAPDQWLRTPSAKQLLWSDLIALRLAVTTV